MLGCGPGALAADAHMLNIDSTTQRKRMVEGVSAILRLFTEQGKISIDGSYFKLVDAHLKVIDDSDMADDFPSDADGEYDLRVKLRARVVE